MEQYLAAVRADDGETDYEGAWVTNGVVEALEVTVRLLALPYADHPDYREEWRP